MKYKFSEIFNITELKKLCQSFTEINGTVTALLDLEGKVYVSTGWQDICVQYHRKHPVCSERCMESDTLLASQANNNSRYNVYKCKNGLIDVSIPIYVKKQHVGNFFTGQFLFEKPNVEYFRKQAEQFGFDEKEYLSALDKVPVFSEEQIRKSALFLANLTEHIGEVGLKEIQIRESAKRLDDEKKKFKVLFEEAVDAIILLKLDGTFLDANQSACSLFKYKKEELRKMRILDVSPDTQYNGESSAEKAKKLIDLTLDDKPQRFEWLHRDKANTIMEASVSLKKIELSGDTYLQAIIRDITEQKKILEELKNHRKNLELLVKERTDELAITNEELKATNEELSSKNRFINDKNEELKEALLELKNTQLKLFQVEKMASLGTLTAGVAHEINNPLNFLAGAYFGLEKYFETFESAEIDKTRTFLDIIKLGIERISNIVKGLNQFSRNTEKHDETCEINPIIENCLVMLHNQFKNKANIQKEYAENLNIIGNVGKMHQVFLNLLSNAIYAISNDGNIKIVTKAVNGNALVEITDDGMGIESNYLSQITDPFFTTKSPGEGTGLGLSITYNIIKEHHGKLEFESEVGKGTKVTVEMPIG